MTAMDIGRYDISDVLGCLPNLAPLNQTAAECDIFVATLGFEDRASTLALEFSNAGLLNNATVILIEYPTNASDNESNLIHFQQAARKAKRLEHFRYSRNEFMTLLQERLAEAFPRSGARVIFDISTCSSYVFYPTMKALMDLDCDLTLVYVEASEYYPSREEWTKVAQTAQQESSLFIESFENAEFQSIGVGDVYVSPLFSEMNPGNRPTTFVGIPNFSAGRMNALVTRDQEINKTSGRNCYWLIGEPPGTANEWRSEAVRRTNANNLAAADESRLKFVSTLEYKDMLKTLEDIWLETRHSYHMSIGTIGSKMQHVGTFFFLCLHKDVGLLLTEPKTFRTTRYSSGRGQAWQICFEHTNALKRGLERYLTFRWQL